jgi:hypothetical protein
MTIMVVMMEMLGSKASPSEAMIEGYGARSKNISAHGYVAGRCEKRAYSV